MAERRLPRATEAAIVAALARIDRILDRLTPLVAQLERNDRRYDELLARCEAQVGLTQGRRAATTIH